MKLDASSFLIGAGLTAALMSSRSRLRPVAVELSALGLHLARLGRSLAARRREDLEDLWAEVEERARERGARRAHAANGNGAARGRA